MNLPAHPIDLTGVPARFHAELIAMPNDDHRQWCIEEARHAEAFRSEQPQHLPRTETQLLSLRKEVRDLIIEIQSSRATFSTDPNTTVYEFFMGGGFGGFVRGYGKHLPKRIIRYLNRPERVRFQRTFEDFTDALFLAFSKNIPDRESRAALKRFFASKLEVFESLLDRIETALDLVESPIQISLAEQLATIGDRWPGLNPIPAPAFPKPPRRKHRSNEPTEEPLTIKQTECVAIVHECKGNIAEAARRLGKDRKTVQECYEAALKKLGKTAIRKPKTQQLSIGRRGEEYVSSDDDRRNR